MQSESNRNISETSMIQDESIDTSKKDPPDESLIDEFIRLFWIPRQYVYKIDEANERKYKLSVLDRIFVTLENSSSCRIGLYVAKFMTGVIVLNILLFIISSFPQFKYKPETCSNPSCNNDVNLCPGKMICQPVNFKVLDGIDLLCVIIFTVDIAVRFSLCGTVPTRLSGTIPANWDELELERVATKGGKARDDPKYSFPEQFLRYVFSFQGIIDVISVVPTYVSLTSSGSNVKLSFFRILRLLRVFRLMRTDYQQKQQVELLSRTLRESRDAVGILCFYMLLAVILFGAILYTIEEGDYIVNSDYPSGAYLRPDGFGGVEESPFNNIPTAMYFTIITMTTVGYGDLAPTTLVGRYIASLVALLGVLVLALPISIVGANFTKEYEKHMIAMQDYRRKMKKARKELKERILKRGTIRDSITNGTLDSTMNDVLDMDEIEDKQILDEVLYDKEDPRSNAGDSNTSKSSSQSEQQENQDKVIDRRHDKTDRTRNQSLDRIIKVIEEDNFGFGEESCYLSPKNHKEPLETDSKSIKRNRIFGIDINPTSTNQELKSYHSWRISPSSILSGSPSQNARKTHGGISSVYYPFSNFSGRNNDDDDDDQASNSPEHAPTTANIVDDKALHDLMLINSDHLTTMSQSEVIAVCLSLKSHCLKLYKQNHRFKKFYSRTELLRRRTLRDDDIDEDE